MKSGLPLAFSPSWKETPDVNDPAKTLLRAGSEPQEHLLRPVAANNDLPDDKNVLLRPHGIKDDMDR